LLTAIEGDTARVIQLDPNAGYAVTVDGDVMSIVTRGLGFPISHVLLAFNDFTPAIDPATHEHVLLIGFENGIGTGAVVPPSEPTNMSPDGPRLSRARYLVRHADGTYDVHFGEDPTLASPPPRHDTRTLAVSPFAEDRDAVVYMGGSDCGGSPWHDTAWALRAPLSIALGHSVRRVSRETQPLSVGL
jgi:hypothetical protein